MPTPKDVQLGKLAIKSKLVSEEKIRECFAFLQEGGNGLSLGQVLLKKGLINEQQFRALEARLQQGTVEAKSAPRLTAARAARPSAAARDSSQSSFGLREIAERDYSALAGQPIDAYLREARRIGASDLHFQVGAPPFFRLHGTIVYLKHPVLTAAVTAPRIKEILTTEQWDILEKHWDLDFCYEADHGRYRAGVLRQRLGFDAVFRVIPETVPTIEDLHLPATLKRFTEYRHGIILITGPAGSGKTATMAALVNIVNRTRHDHIVTVEDPIEYVIESENCNVDQRQVKLHTKDYQTALRSAMRADPDYICVGEMRDLETISIAITAAETGHLVFGTLHTQNATRSVDRIIDVFPPKEQEQIRAMVSESLRGVVSQQLLPRSDGYGREPAVEILFATSAVRNLIREHKTFQLPSVVQTGQKQGMVTMDDSIIDLLRRDVITRQTALYHAENPSRIP